MQVRYRTIGLIAAAVLALVPALASATPDPNSAVIQTRIFNDCPSSLLTFDNSYPSEIWIEDAQLNCFGFANLHNWRFSEDGSTPAVFNNNSNFQFGADLVITGTTTAEAGLQVAPWWSQDVDGRLNVRIPDGEIAAFGGRLPFYSFSANHGIFYQAGETIHLEIIYLANDLTQENPATIEYKVTYQGMDYSSGVLPFDEGNPNEPYGLWGMLDDGRVGAHFQPQSQGGNDDAQARAVWTNIYFENLDQEVPTLETSWGRMKQLFR